MTTEQITTIVDTDDNTALYNNLLTSVVLYIEIVNV